MCRSRHARYGDLGCCCEDCRATALSFLADRLGNKTATSTRVRVYAGGGYVYPQNDIARLSDEMRRFVDLGFTHAKMKIGADLNEDLRRIEAAAAQLQGGGHLAVDAMNTYDIDTGVAAATALASLGLWWFEDVCDPLDFSTQTSVAASYGGPIAAGKRCSRWRRPSYSISMVGCGAIGIFYCSTQPIATV